MSIPYNGISQTDWTKILLSDSNVQTGGILVGFKGTPFQRGHGIGNLFRSLFRLAAPITKNVIKSVAKQGLSSAVQVGSDILEGKNLKESVKNRSKMAGKRLLKKGVKSISRKLQRGSGIGYKKKIVKRKKRQLGFGKKRSRKNKGRSIIKRRIKNIKNKKVIDFLGL